MGTLRILGSVGVGTAVALGVAALAAGSGGEPPPQPDAAPELRTVVAHGAGAARVARTRDRERAIRAAVTRAEAVATPRAVAAARAEARRLADAAGLELGEAMGVAREVAPVGTYAYYDASASRFGPGVWCGTIGSPGNRRRHCDAPETVSVRVALTVAAG